MNFKDWLSDEDVKAIYENESPSCPQCGSPMVLRTARQGYNAGNQFYGCSNYPNCKGTMGYNPSHSGGQQQYSQQNQQRGGFNLRGNQPQVQQRTWVYAKVTKKGDKRFPTIGKEIALSKRADGHWDYMVLDTPNDTGVIYDNEAKGGLIESLRNLKTNKPLTSTNPSLADLEQQFAQMGGGREEEIPQTQQPEEKKPSKKTIPDNMISQEQSAIDNRFSEIVNSDKKQNLMINALAGTGKTTMLKHLAWKYGKPGERWLYLVFNTKNKVEAQEEFPPFVDVRTSNGFTGEVLGDKANINRIGQTDRMVRLQDMIRDSGGKLEKSREIADSPQFSDVLTKLGIPERVDPYEYGKIGKTLNSLLKGIRYTFKEAVLQLTGLGKSFALDPRDDQSLMQGLNKVLGSYDIDTELIDIKERIAKYSPSFRTSVEHYLEDIMGYNFMDKDFRDELLKGTVWMMHQLMPNATSVRMKRAGGHNLSQYRDFDDDLWYAATHANEIQWPRYNVVLADEVQDFNEAQKVMLKKLSDAGARIVAVGDPNQSIYRFRGADGQAFNNLAHMLGDLSEGDDQVVYNLTNNYRSRPEILDFANEETVVDGLKSGRDWGDESGGQVTKGELTYNDTFDDISKEVAENGGKVPKETAFIARTNEPLVKTALGFLAKNIPFIIVGKDIARDLMKQVYKISNMKRLDDRTSSRTLAAELSEFLDQEKESHHGKSTKKAYLQETEELTEALLACIDSYEAESGGYNGGTIGGFKQWIASRLGGLEVEENQKDLERYRQIMKEQNPIVLTTAHKSKGLEFARVYILRYDQFPHPKAQREEDLQQEENARYVALTRAQDELHILDLEGQPGYQE